MDTTKRTQVLADSLARAYSVAALCQVNGGHNGTSPSRFAATWLTDDGHIANAVAVELGELTRDDPEMAGMVAASTHRAGRRLLARHLWQELERREHLRDSLLALLLDDLDEGGTDPRLGRWARSRNWLRRQGVLAWMHILIIAPMLLVYLTVWGGRDGGTSADELAVGALKAFSIWTLSFLPSWLYVRFLGQRASALWNEYVIHLHRLALDEPQFLPRPPRTSEFYSEWLKAGGYLQHEEHNLYRQKFNAYYGRAVSSSGRSSDFAVRTETLFPVFLATAVLATIWTAVLWDVGFVLGPDDFWDVLKIGFLGAYGFTMQSLIRRFFQSDLRPSAYAAVLLRIVVVFTVLVPVFQLIEPLRPGVVAATAFAVGAFPVVGLYAVHRTAAWALRAAVPQLTPRYPLNQVDGLNVWYEARLVEEGIEDMQNLVTANLVDVILHTRVPVGRLVDWVDQAHLYLHLDHSERTVRERRRAMRKDAGAAAANPADDRLRGSLGRHSRAGTRTRIALRQMGIRTATDLLKAFPPDQIDPRDPRPDTVPGDYLTLLPRGVDPEQIRMLARVLSEADLAPIWNWQCRGVATREPARRPRSRVKTA